MGGKTFTSLSDSSKVKKTRRVRIRASIGFRKPRSMLNEREESQRKGTREARTGAGVAPGLQGRRKKETHSVGERVRGSGDDATRLQCCY